jgi:hypothetical protein
MSSVIVTKELIDAVINELKLRADFTDWMKTVFRPKLPINDARLKMFIIQSKRLGVLNPVISILPSDLETLTDGDKDMEVAALTFAFIQHGVMDITNLHPQVDAHLRSTMPQLHEWMHLTSAVAYDRARATDHEWVANNPEMVEAFRRIAGQLDMFLYWCSTIPDHNQSPHIIVRPEHYTNHYRSADTEAGNVYKSVSVYTNTVDADYCTASCELWRIILGVAVNRPDMWEQYRGAKDMRYYATISRGDKTLVTRGQRAQVFCWCGLNGETMSSYDYNPYTILAQGLKAYEENPSMLSKGRGDDRSALGQIRRIPPYSYNYLCYEDRVDAKLGRFEVVNLDKQGD